MKSDYNYEHFLSNLSNVTHSEDCTAYKTLELFQGKWKIRVLFELSKGNCTRFGEIKKLIPEITNTMLTSTLKELEQKKLIHREQFNEIPPRVEYSLSESGKDLLPIFFEISKWGQKHMS